MYVRYNNCCISKSVVVVRGIAGALGGEGGKKNGRTFSLPSPPLPPPARAQYDRKNNKKSIGIMDTYQFFS